MLDAFNERLAAINQKIDPFRYYVLRLLRVFVFYHAFVFAAEASISRMPFGNPDIVSEYNPFRFHFASTFSIVLVYAMVAGIFILYDATARRRFVKAPPVETHYFSEHLGILRSYEFLCHAAAMLILPLVSKSNIFAHPVCLFFGREGFSEIGIYIRYLLTAFPLFLLIEILFRLRTRTFWRELRADEAIDMHFDLIKIALIWVLIAFVYGYIAQFYLPAIPIALGFFAYPITWVIILGVLFGIFLFRRLRAMKIRKKFIQNLRQFCKEYHFELSDIKHPYRSIFRNDRGYHFTVKAYGKTYACKMLAAISKDAKMIFLDENMGYFKTEMKVKNSELTLYRKKFYYGFDAPDADHKVLIVSPAPHTMLAVNTKVAFASDGVTYVKESTDFKYVDNATNVFGLTVFSGSAFINALERNCLYVKPE